MTKSIGLIGKGFIGEAFYEHMKDYYKVLIWDKDINKCNVASLKEVVEQCQCIFISLPTPMCLKTGECDIGIIKKVILEINNLIGTEKRILIIRSTYPPGTTEKLNQLTKNNLSFVFNPEFLTELNFIQDFRNQNRIVLGGNQEELKIVKEIYRQAFPNTLIVETSTTIAELVKYATNSFLATKVIFANEIKQVCDYLGISYEEVVKIITLDSRVGQSHWKVPGTDGKIGFGGTCFPKDINGFIYFAQTIELEMLLLKAAWKHNLLLRPERDWENAKGRAIQQEDETND